MVHASYVVIGAQLAVWNQVVMRPASVTKLLILSVVAVTSCLSVVCDDVNWAPSVWLIIHASYMIVGTHASSHVTCKLQYY